MIENIRPTQAELEILQVLWKTGPASVKQVNEILSEKKPRGYTTTLKLMQIMKEKGLVDRTADGKMHIYEAGFGEDEIKKSVVSNMVEQVFEGEPMRLVMQTLGNYRPSHEEITELKALLDSLENSKES